MVQELTDQTLDAFVDNEPCAVIKFYATWCPPCERLSPIMEEIANEHSDDLVVGKINVDTNPESVDKFGVMSTPTIIVFQRGQVVSQFVGFRPKQNLLDLLGLGVI